MKAVRKNHTQKVGNRRGGGAGPKSAVKPGSSHLELAASSSSHSSRSPLSPVSFAVPPLLAHIKVSVESMLKIKV